MRLVMKNGKKVKMWQFVTHLDKSKQVLALALRMNGQYRKVGREVPSDQLIKENGADTPLTKLDGNFFKETPDRAYESFESFDNFCRENRACQSILWNSIEHTIKPLVSV